MQEFLDAVAGFVWGPTLLIPLLLVTGLYLTIRLRGLQVRRLGYALWLALIRRREAGTDGDIPHYQALTVSLAATVGVGNIAGVATAIFVGGPGALFWMWLTGLLGMATKYSEAFLGVRFRKVDAAGQYSGGPQVYLSEGIRGPFGTLLAVFFAIAAAIAAFGIGSTIQSNTVAVTLEAQFGVETWVSGIVLTVASGIVVLGGITAIGRFTGFFVPIMIGAYCLGALVVVLTHLDAVPAAIGTVFTHAFSGTAATGGFAGALLAATIRYGVARGMFSNEAGLGSGAIAAAAAQTSHPVRQAMVGMTQTFIDTLVVVTFTGLAIIVTGVWTTGETGAALTRMAFQEGLPGEWGGTLVTLGICLFAYSTLIGWGYYGERNVERLLGSRAIPPYRILFVAAIYVGAVQGLELVWAFADISNGLMALPNLIGLLVLSGLVARETKEFFARDDWRTIAEAGVAPMPVPPERNA